MTQNANDVEIANQGFAAFRQDLNDVLEDITTLHSGDTAPTTTYANQFWYETDTDKLYIRNEDNDAWIEILTLDQANDHLASLGATITLDGSGNVGISGNVLVGGTASPSGSGQIVATGGVYLGGIGPVNHLDDYEEGNWTPSFSRASTPFTTTPTYSFLQGRYIKVGKLVHATCYLRFSNNFSGGSGHYNVGGLPFTAGSQLQGVANGITSVFAGDLNHSRGNYVTGTTVRYDAGHTLSPTTTSAYLTFTVTYEVT